MTKLLYGFPRMHKIDPKGRVSIPASIRNWLESDVIYTNCIAQNILRCYPEDHYQAKSKDMLIISPNDRERQLFFLAEERKIDKQGRLLLQGPLSDLEHVIIAANGDVFDIYDPGVFPYKFQPTL